MISTRPLSPLVARRAVRKNAMIRTRSRSGVKRARPDQTIIVMLFDHMRAPAGHARRSKNRRVELRWKTEHPKHGRRVKIDICAKMLLPVHRFLELFTN